MRHDKYKWFGILAGLVVTCGCRVGPDYARPETRIAPEWGQSADDRVEVSEDSPEHRDWWTTLNDPVLDQLVDLAYTQNHTLQIAGLRVLEARARRGIAVGQFFPQLQSASANGGGFGLSDNAANATLLDQSFSNYDVGFQAAWELDLWGKFRRAIDSADAAMMSAVATYDDVLVSMVAGVAASYVELRAFEERLALAQTNVKTQQRSLDITQARFEGGAVSELDVAQARTILATTQALVPILEQGRTEAVNRLCTLLGHPPGALQDMLTQGAPIPTAPQQIVLGIPADLLRRRPDVRAAERRAAALNESIGIATADYYPSFTISGFTGLETSTGYSPALGLGSKPDFNDLFDADSFTGFINFGFNWPILNYGRIANNIRVQDARFEQAATAYKDAVVRAAAEVENALAAFLHAQDRTTHLAESVAAAERSVELAITQYTDGACAYTRVLNTQTALTVQQDAYAASKAAVALNLIRAYRAIGGGWQLREGQEFIAPDVAERMDNRSNWNGVMSTTESTSGERLFKLATTPDTP
jgi:NodT family efflux transporter outer membrane factor (OMF) lipoprotein